MIPVYVTLEFSGLASISKRKSKEITRRAHRVQALYWHRKMVDYHFHASARYRYGYRRRTRRYSERKRRMAKRGRVAEGGTRDLVFTGLTRAKMLRPPHVQAFPTRAKLTYATPSCVSMRYKPGRPQMGKELTAVVPSEVRTLEQVISREVDRSLREWPVPTKVVKLP